MKEVLTIEKTAVWFGESFLSEAFHFSESSVLILDEKVPFEVPDSLCECVLKVPGGEAVKSRSTLIQLQDELLARGFGKETHIVACGGGATLDLVGFLAATYSHGVPLTFIPSTLLGMCDAAIGGKNSLNVGRIKNAIGTIYHPKRVIIDVCLLESLPQSELNNGIVEMVKHVLLDSEPSVYRLEQHITSLQAKDRAILLSEIQKSSLVKKRYIEGVGIRDLLSFGHTFGHAIEALEGFCISHGQAVALGLLAESYLALYMDELPEQDFTLIERVIRALEIPLTLSKKYSKEEWLGALGKRPFVLLQKIGQPFGRLVEVSQEILSEVIDELEKENLFSV